MTSEFTPSLDQAKQVLNESDLIKFNAYYWYLGSISANHALNMSEILESFSSKYLKSRSEDYLEYALLIEKIENFNPIKGN